MHLSFLCLKGYALEGKIQTELEGAVSKFDVIVIGSGGGTKLVRPVAKKGHKVAVIEKEKLGGTCLNRGCIPSKMLIHAADVAMQIKEARKFGLVTTTPEILFEELVNRVNKKIAQESQSIEPLYEKDENITLFKGHAKFISNNEIEINNQKITADKIIIATGADAAKLPLEGIDQVPFMTYRDALKNTKLPKKLIVIGGGYIATELGYFFGALGVETHFFVRSELLRKEDSEIKKEFDQAFSKLFHVHKKITLKRVDHHDGLFILTYLDEHKKEQTIQADGFLSATGVAPNTQNLGLENTDIQLTDRGFIKVDSFLQTDAKGVYALGDCVGNFLFRHSANFEGEYLQRHLFEGESKPLDYAPMPHAVFTHPQIAGVGATEDELIKNKIPYIKGTCKYSHSAMGMALLPEYGFVKLLFHKDTKELLGAHIIGEESSVMIHMLIILMTKKGTLDDLLQMIYIHPALPEIVRNAARDASQAFLGADL